MTNLDVISRRSHPAVNPLDETFSNERIFLNDFVLPSRPAIEKKNFMNCEIVGPANIILAFGTTIHDIKGGRLEAVRMDMNVSNFSGYVFRECVFRGCSFHRITLFIPDNEFPQYVGNQNLEWLASGDVLNQQAAFTDVDTADLYGQPRQPEQTPTEEQS
ncbi:hypothetical protein [Mariluticola halotolerans]|uniref:hypothetical protein n=1 Tax=Mariluticola halotolerans TaxID=2909283 RepID=UPI0026E35D15|nr:hypothetical protein [Mariluticola halotolerans]UJQ93741.1 hypothetical protein L1P08_12225 [Mariluticola halotolerans]